MKKVSAQTSTKRKAPRLTEDKVASYLRANPKFFINNCDILDNMEAPERWSDNGIVDMQKFLLDRRSTEIDELRDCAQEVIETSRSNLSAQTRTHAAVLALISANGLDQFVQILSDDVSFFLDIDFVNIGFEIPENTGAKLLLGNMKLFDKGIVGEFLGLDQEIKLYPQFDDDGTFFSSGSDIVHSCALARINPVDNFPVGILALGSRGRIFHSGQGTELINFLARVSETLVHRHLRLGI